MRLNHIYHKKIIPIYLVTIRPLFKDHIVPSTLIPISLLAHHTQRTSTYEIGNVGENDFVFLGYTRCVSCSFGGFQDFLRRASPPDNNRRGGRFRFR